MAAGISRPDVWTGIALNRDPGDPNTPSIWTSLESATLQVISVSGEEYGRDYELAQPMSSDPTLLIRDPNEYLNPDNPSSPYAGQIEPYREVCQLCQWPITGAGSTGNLINSGTWRGSRVDAYDPTFDSYTTGAQAPNWLIRVNTTGVLISTASPRTGTKHVRYAVSDTSMGVGFGVPVIPGRQYTTSVYVQQSAACTQRIYVAGVTACYDPFGRTVANDWGTPVVGAAYTEVGTASDYSVSAGTAVQVNTSTATPRIATQGTFYNAQQYVVIPAPALATGASYVIGAVVRFASSTNYYRGGLEFKTDGSIGLLVEKVVAGAASTVVSTPTTLAYAVGEEFNLCLQQSGKFLEAHVWPTDKRESMIYSTTFVLDGAFTGDGAIGLYSYRAAGNTNTNLPAQFRSYRAFGTVGGTSTSATGSYQRLSVTYTADTPARPAMADSIQSGTSFVVPLSGQWVYVATQGAAVAATVDIDDIMHEQAASASAFTSTGPNIFPLFRNLAERYPRSWAASGYEGFTALPCVDALSALNKIFILNEADQAIVNTQPDLFYPLSDGSDTGLFLDQSGNNGPPLQPVLSKYGAGQGIEPGTALNLPGGPGTSGVLFHKQTLASATSPGTIIGTGRGAGLPGGAVSVPPAGGIPWGATICAWVRISDITAYDVDILRIMSRSRVLVMRATAASTVTGIFAIPLTAPIGTATLSHDLWDGQLHFVGLSVAQDATNTTVTLYVDGDTNAVTFSTATAGGISAATMDTIEVGGLDSDYTGSYNSPVDGTMAKVAIWNRTLSASEMDDMNFAGAFGKDGEVSGSRVLRHVQTGGYYGPTRIANGSTNMGIPSFDGSIDLLTDTLNTTQAEMGTVWVEPDGVLAFEGRQERWLRLTATAVVGENQAGGEIPYLGGVILDHDPTYVYPIVTWTRNGGATALGGLPAARQAAVRKFFPRQFNGQSDLFDDATAQYLADWIFYSHRAPMTRWDTLEIDPWSNPDLWPLVLRLRVGQRVTAIRRAKSANAGAGLVMSADYFIEKIGQPEVNFRQDSQIWTVALQLSPIGAANAPSGPTNQPWILEDTTYGVLDQTTVLGW